MTKQDYTPDWASIEPEYKWVAVDADGEVFAYAYRPYTILKLWNKVIGLEYIERIAPPGENFKDMIYERPQ